MPVYSYHTFVLPFIWNMGKKDFESFCKPFCNSPHWRCTDIKTENRLTPNENILSMDDARLIYAEYQYFNPAARRAVYGFESGIVKNFCFNPVNVRNKGKYIIEKDGIKYTLNMNGLRLKIYNTGVALFIFECENPRGEGFEAQNTVAAVKSINEYGRRITLPFLPNETGFILCADKLTVEIDGVGTFVENFKNFSSSISSVEEIYSKVSLTHICDFIKNIIGFGTDIKFSSNPKKILERNTFYIYPAIDDRMFVISLIVDEEGVAWEEAWNIVKNSCAYTNHTILAEALEKWPVDLVRNLLPRIYTIIEEIDRRFCHMIYEKYTNYM